MASTKAPEILTFFADAAIAKGKAVKIGSDSKHVALGVLNTDRCCGLAQSASAAAEELIEVALPGGGAKALLGETVAAGDDLVSHTDGTLVKPNAAGDEIIARAMDSGVSGDLIDVIVVVSSASAAQ